jgi:hypothetical protein
MVIMENIIDTEWNLFGKSTEELMSRGRERFGEGNIISAYACFSKACKQAVETEDLVVLHLNISACCLKLPGKSVEAFNEAKMAYDMDEEGKLAQKACFRMAQASFNMDKLSRAHKWADRALELQPGEAATMALQHQIQTEKTEKKVHRCNLDSCSVEKAKHTCGRCHGAFYCSPAHQKLDWPEHKNCCLEIRDVVEAECRSSLSSLLQPHGSPEGFERNAARTGKLLMKRMERESNAPSKEQLNQFCADMSTFITHPMGKKELKTVKSHIWTMNTSHIVDFAQRGMGMFTLAQAMYFLPFFKMEELRSDLKNWIGILRNGVKDKAYVINLIFAAFSGIQFYRSMKNKIVMPTESELNARACLGSEWNGYAGLVDMLGETLSPMPPKNEQREESALQTSEEYNAAFRSKFLATVVIGAARSLAARMEGTPAMIWNGFLGGL